MNVWKSIDQPSSFFTSFLIYEGIRVVEPEIQGRDSVLGFVGVEVFNTTVVRFYQSVNNVGLVTELVLESTIPLVLGSWCDSGNSSCDVHDIATITIIM